MCLQLCKAHEYLTKQAVRKLTIGCLLLNNPCCILAPQCFTLLQLLTGFVGTFGPDSENKIWPTPPHAWWTKRYDSSSRQLLLRGWGQIILLTFSITIKVFITKTAMDWTVLVLIIFCWVCQLLVCGRVVVYSLIRVLLSMFPHCKRQSRLEEKHLTLIPLILRERENVKLFNRLHRRSICPE